MENSLQFRLAQNEDLDQIAKICQQSFTESLLWQSKMARNWWQTVINTSAAESWVLIEKNEIVAICLLIVDENQWNNLGAPQRGPLLKHCLAALCHPIIVGKWLKTTINQRKNKNIKPVDHQNMPEGWGPAMRIWVELVAIGLEHRGKGIPKIILQKCADRARQLNRIATALRVDIENKHAVCAFKKYGMFCYRSDVKSFYLAKYIDNNQNLAVTKNNTLA